MRFEVGQKLQALASCASSRGRVLGRSFARRLAVLLVLPCVLGTLRGAPAAVADSSPLVAAASDLKFALEALADQYEHESGTRVRVTFAASGQLARQLAEGAPFELFMSADEELVLGLAEKQLTKDRGALYGVGRLALFVPHGSPLAAEGDLHGMRALLQGRLLTRFAIANPAHAPYGRAAEQALRHAELWESLKASLVLGDTVAQAAQFVASGQCQGGIIAHSLALSPTLKDRGRFALIPESFHSPLRQRMVLMKHASAAAQRFYTWLGGERARATFTRFGFALPGG